MITKLSQDINTAVKLLQDGEVIGLPTETVYGLAGAINNEQALKNIFVLKERPLFDPLIVHVADKQSVFNIFATWNNVADVLSTAFWPGAMTIVLPKKAIVNPLITSGLDTVAVRFPAHAVAREVIKRVGVPLAAPSANKFGRTSPSCPEHVLSEFKDDGLFILDGGSCQVGVESTVLSPEENEVVIYRPGMVTKEMIELELKRQGININVGYANSNVAPGHLDHHYMPKKPLVLLDGSEIKNGREIDPDVLNRIADRLGFVLSGESKPKYAVLWFGHEAVLAARILYARLRELEQQEIDFIVTSLPDTTTDSSWDAIRDRLIKAATVFAMPAL